MAKIDTYTMIKELQKSKQEFMAAITVLEDSNIDDQTRKEAALIIQDAQVQSEIALEQIQG